MDDFDWNTGRSVAIPATAAVAVYTNDDGDIVIRRQRDASFEQGDAVVVVPRAHIGAFVRAIRAAAKG